MRKNHVFQIFVLSVVSSDGIDRIVVVFDRLIVAARCVERLEV